MPERVLVTGGAGFIGSHVADKYLEAGYDVTILDDLSTGRRRNVPSAATFVEADIGSPASFELISQGAFDVVNHQAAQIDVRVSVEDPKRDAHTNILGFLNVLEAARAGGTRCVVFASSGGVVYGESNDLPHKENARKLPISPYGVSKLTTEFYLMAYAQMYGLHVVSLRYANVFGPRQNPEGEAGVVAIFCSRIQARKPITIFGDGEQTRDYVYAEDVARANVAAATWERTDLDTIDAVAFNVGTGSETSVNALASALIDATRIDVPIEHAPARTGELLRSAVDIQRTARELQWSPSVSLSEGLKRTYHWIAENDA